MKEKTQYVQCLCILRHICFCQNLIFSRHLMSQNLSYDQNDMKNTCSNSPDMDFLIKYRFIPPPLFLLSHERNIKWPFAVCFSMFVGCTQRELIKWITIFDRQTILRTKWKKNQKKWFLSVFFSYWNLQSTWKRWIELIFVFCFFWKYRTNGHGKT